MLNKSILHVACLRTLQYLSVPEHRYSSTVTKISSCSLPSLVDYRSFCRRGVYPVQSLLLLPPYAASRAYSKSRNNAISGGSGHSPPKALYIHLQYRRLLSTVHYPCTGALTVPPTTRASSSTGYFLTATATLLDWHFATYAIPLSQPSARFSGAFSRKYSH